jgi:large subunit ribosomal protein L6
MSRVGFKPVPIPDKVEVKVDGRTVSAKGPKGESHLLLPPLTHVAVQGGQVVVTRDGDGKEARAYHGTARNLIANLVRGVQEGYSKNLEIQGVGFKAAAQGQKVIFSLGYSHPIEFMVPAGVKVAAIDATNVQVSGVDRQLVGQVSARIKSFFPAEPYKGKGVRFKGEHVRRKVGKTVS